MFAAAAREVVFSNPAVVQRINKSFVPVALKAANVNNPPSSVEGKLLAEISRSKPAAQGICVANSDGKVLAWTLSFDDPENILAFLDHVERRYQEFPNAEVPVPAERYRRFPSVKMPDVADTTRKLQFPDKHLHDDPCPGMLPTQSGDLIGSIIGQSLDENGAPRADTARQEYYMEARLQIPIQAQAAFVRAARDADGQRFELPKQFVDHLVGPAYLGMLDVNPTGSVRGSQNTARHRKFHGRQIPVDDTTMRIQIEGTSNTEGRLEDLGKLASGHDWNHRVTLNWYGFVDIARQKVETINIIAAGDERLIWKIPNATSLHPAAQLPSGHSIDMEGGVRYGLFAPSRSSSR